MWEVMIAALVSFIAGGINAVAGGGTLLTFPLLIGLGVPTVEANATSAIALWPAGAAATWGYRENIRESGRIWVALLVPSILGGVMGALLVVELPREVFERVAPYLVLGAAVLMAVEPKLRGRLKSRFSDLTTEQENAETASQSALSAGSNRRASTLVASIVCALIAAYGGYFGAGIGILLLATLSLSSVHDIHQANGIKNLISTVIKGAAILYFAVSGVVAWRFALPMVLTSMAGGFLAAEMGRRVSQESMRRFVVGSAVMLGGVMLVQIWT